LRETTQLRIVKGEESTNRLHRTASLLLAIFTILMVVTFLFLITRRWLLIIDAILEGYGSGGFLNRSELLTNKDLLANFTKVFDSLQVLALFGILIAFILVLISSRDENRKYFIGIVICFSIMLIIRLIRVIILHRGPDDYILIGIAFNLASEYYEFAFYIYSTDMMRIIIMLLLIVSVIFFIKYLQQRNETKPKIKNTIPTIAGIFLILYIISAILGANLFEKIGINSDIAFYYIHYGISTLLQIGNIVAYLYIGRKRLLIIAK
jgi:hypothetical protein